MLILGPTIKYDVQLHVVCDYNSDDEIVAVTVYVPDRPRWINDTVRGQWRAFSQLLRYSNQHEEVTEPEGAERLFRYAQVMIATCFETAQVGTVGASYEHYLEWRETYAQTLGVSENPKGLRGQRKSKGGRYCDPLLSVTVSRYCLSVIVLESAF